MMTWIRMTKKLNSRFGSRRHLPPRQPRRRCLDGRLIGQPILRSVIHLGNKNQVEWCNAGNKYASPNIKSSRSNSVAFTYPADRRPDGTFLAWIQLRTNALMHWFIWVSESKILFRVKQGRAKGKAKRRLNVAQQKGKEGGRRKLNPSKRATSYRKGHLFWRWIRVEGSFNSCLWDQYCCCVSDFSRQFCNLRCRYWLSCRPS